MLQDGQKGLVPLNHLVEGHAEDDASESRAQSADAAVAEALGQSRAVPDWGYDHGLEFEELYL